MRNAILGAAAGLLAGWLLFGQSAEPRNRAAAVPPRAPSEPRGSEAVPVEGAHAPAAPEGPTDRAWVRKADAQALGRIAAAARAGEPVQLSPEVVAEAIARIDEARAGRDWNLFVGLVRFLGAAGTAEAQGKLVALMGDPTLLFHDWRVAGDFRAALAGPRAEGAVAAARARIEMERAHYEDKERWQGWYEIVARHGSEADIDWLLAFEASNRKPGSDHELSRALAAAATNRPAADAFMDLWRAGRIRDEGDAFAFARTNPAAAFPFFRQEFESGGHDPVETARAFGGAVTAETLGDAKAFLLSLRDPVKRLAAPYAVTSMTRGKLDVTGLEPVLLAPVEEAERLATATREERERWFYSVLYGIEYNRPAWSERAARALERLAAAYEDKGRADALRDVAREIRAQIGSDASDWVKKD